ncbi:hypothetical protein ACP4OV_007976 [Aristida adscensionis]
MSRPAGSVRRAAAAALAISLAVLVLMSLVMDDGKAPALPASEAAIGGRRMVAGAGGGQRTSEDLRADDDPFQDSKRRVPNGPDPIHNSGNWQVRKIAGPGMMACIPRHGSFRRGNMCGANRWCIARRKRRNRQQVHCGGSGWMWV